MGIKNGEELELFIFKYLLKSNYRSRLPSINSKTHCLAIISEGG